MVVKTNPLFLGIYTEKIEEKKVSHNNAIVATNKRILANGGKVLEKNVTIISVNLTMYLILIKT